MFSLLNASTCSVKKLLRHIKLKNNNNEIIRVFLNNEELKYD